MIHRLILFSFNWGYIHTAMTAWTNLVDYPSIISRHNRAGTSRPAKADRVPFIVPSWGTEDQRRRRKTGCLFTIISFCSMPIGDSHDIHWLWPRRHDALRICSAAATAAPLLLLLLSALRQAASARPHPPLPLCGPLGAQQASRQISWQHRISMRTKDSTHWRLTRWIKYVWKN